MIDIVHRIGTTEPVAKVYAALSTIEGLSGWWSSDTRGSAAPGGTIEFTFNKPDGERLGNMHMQVMRLDENREVSWRCTAGPEEWIGTDVTFRLTREGEHTIVNFGHRNWRKATDFTGHCSTKWGSYLMSLKALVESGEGRPNPRDVKVADFD